MVIHATSAAARTRSPTRLKAKTPTRPRHETPMATATALPSTWVMATTTAIADTASKQIHAIDLHPFAAFLTYVNFLFGILPMYGRVRDQRKAYRLTVAIFSGSPWPPTCI